MCECSQVCGGSVYITSLYLTQLKDLWYTHTGNADFLMEQCGSPVLERKSLALAPLQLTGA